MCLKRVHIWDSVHVCLFSHVVNVEMGLRSGDLTACQSSQSSVTYTLGPLKIIQQLKNTPLHSENLSLGSCGSPLDLKLSLTKLKVVHFNLTSQLCSVTTCHSSALLEHQVQPDSNHLFSEVQDLHQDFCKHWNQSGRMNFFGLLELPRPSLSSNPPTKHWEHGGMIWEGLTENLLAALHCKSRLTSMYSCGQ